MVFILNFVDAVATLVVTLLVAAVVTLIVNPLCRLQACNFVYKHTITNVGLQNVHLTSLLNDADYTL